MQTPCRERHVYTYREIERGEREEQETERDIERERVSMCLDT